SSGRVLFTKEHPSYTAFGKAFSEYRQSLDVENDLPDVLVERGFVELFAGQPAAASKVYRQALQINDKLADAAIGLAVVRLAGGDRKEALKQARQAFDISGSEKHRKLIDQLNNPARQ